MQMNRNIYILLSRVAAWCCICFLAVCTLSSCRRNAVPKPYGYVRLTMPDTCYRAFPFADYPYRFDVSCNARVQPVAGEDGGRYWLNISYPALGATVHCSYQPVRGNLRELTDDAVKFVYRHASHARAIPERGFENPAAHVYGVLFDLEGNTASSMQFFVTDSTRHFFRAAAYCECVPNADSLAPIYDYLHKDVVRMVESFEFQ